VPVAAGGNVDIIARTLAAKLSESLGHQVLVDNRPSASSLVGTQLVAKSPPDGYTLLAIANTFASAPGIVSSAGYDPVKDFTGVSQTARIPMVLDVNPSLPVKSVKELIALAKARPGQLAYASSGTGSTGHIAAELFSRQAGVKMLHVPYKGNAQSLVDLIGGQVMVMFDQISTSTPHIRSGKIRPLGVTTLTRAPLFPDIPTIDESGLKGFEDVTFNGIMAPAGTPAAIVTRLHGEVVKAVKLPDVRKRFEEQGIELAASASAEQFTAYIKSESAKYAKLAKEAGIRAD
jgi:tripartite-type tricarboxylate transporter receptor subunit TctC